MYLLLKLAKINLAESEDLSPLETSEEKCDKKCDISETVSKDCTKNIEVKEDVPAEDEKRDRKPPVRRPSLLKTVVNIKHDQQHFNDKANKWVF